MGGMPAPIFRTEEAPRENAWARGVTTQSHLLGHASALPGNRAAPSAVRPRRQFSPLPFRRAEPPGPRWVPYRFEGTSEPEVPARSWTTPEREARRNTMQVGIADWVTLGHPKGFPSGIVPTGVRFYHLFSEEQILCVCLCKDGGEMQNELLGERRFF